MSDLFELLIIMVLTVALFTGMTCFVIWFDHKINHDRKHIYFDSREIIEHTK